MPVNESVIDSAPGRPLEVQITLTITLAVIIILAIFGNTLVFITVLRSSKLRRQLSSIFLLNLAITDVGCALLVMPFALTSVWQNTWIFGDFWCDGVCFFNYCFIIVSMATLALISLDRYIFVVHPLRYEKLVTKPRAIAACCLGWLFGIAFGVAPAVANWVWYDNSEIICAIDWENETYSVVTYTVTAFVICFMIPIMVMCFAYYRIYKVARSHSNRIAHRLQSARSHRSQDVDCQRGRQSVSSGVRSVSKYNAKAIKTILIMIIAYLLCNTPFSLTKLIKVIYSDNESVPPGVNTLASWLAFVNPCCNPIIYAINREEFREAFCRTLCCKNLDEGYSGAPKASVREQVPLRQYRNSTECRRLLSDSNP
ncbi:beta-2 adrenergic receptor-like [Amphiura filiformis]|uniref:beta-2 adrenergic receptor-like n=1 Tax=Amphiura filiformis TaxID=82378 RepID=UPI003B214859